jgi:tetratricopeptide (TPR) repeat protein
MKRQGKLDQALKCFNSAIRLDPDMAEAHCNLADLSKAMGKIDQAINAYLQVLRIKPDYLEVLNNLGIAYNEQGHYEQALECYRNALALNSNVAEIYSNIGNSLRSQGNVIEAIDCYRRALEINPNIAEVHHLLGIALQQVDQTEAAIASYQQAIDIRPEFAEAFGDLGNAFKDLCQLEEARQCCDSAVKINSNYAPAHLGRAITLLLNGELEKAWEDYEWRFKADNNNVRFSKMFDKLRWMGSSFKGKTLLIYSEQGLGDTIQFIRYLPMVKALGGTVVVATYESLINLLQGFHGIDELVILAADLKSRLDYDLSLPVVSLPRIFNTNLKTIPAGVPYLHADLQKQSGWRNKLMQSGFKVGLVWRGNPSHCNDHRRSLSLDCLSAVTEIPGIQFYSLQKGEVAPSEEKLLQKMNWIDLGNEFEDFSDTAGAIANLDLIISVDTSVVHLAGAMGRNVWALLPFAPDWRWMLHRDDSPWYPTMRLFRQAQRGNWDSVINHVAAELDLLAHPR